MCGALFSSSKTMFFFDIKFKFRQLSGLLNSSVGEELEIAYMILYIL
jgi:hypothetical protein